MKKYIFLTAFMILVSGMTFDAMGMDSYQPRKKKGWSWSWFWNWGSDNGWSSGNGNGNGSGSGSGSGGAVGAPLDGGLLLVLGAAGTAYVTARKKKKDTDE